MVSFSSTLPAVSDPDLDAVEAKFGFQFPAAVRRHYLRANGGRPSPRVFVDGDLAYEVLCFLPIRHGGGHEVRLEQVVEDFRGIREVPRDLVPFAMDRAGDYFCFRANDPDRGAIFMFRAEMLPNLEQALEPICGSMDDFLTGLTADE